MEEELVSPRALSVLVDALADGPVALADVLLVRVRVRVRVRFTARVRVRLRLRARLKV